MTDITCLKEQLIDAMTKLDDEQAQAFAEELISLRIPSAELQACLDRGLKQVNTLFEEGEYFLADLMFAGMLYRSILDLIPVSENSSVQPHKCVLIGVVERDIHGIGKDIVSGLLKANNFNVVDLGTNVSPSSFVNAIRTHHPQIVLMSGMMHYSQDSMKRTVEAITEAGLRDSVTILIGGGCVNDSILEYIGADARVNEPLDTIALCNQLISRGIYEE